MLKINHYTKRFGEKVAVDDLSLHIQRGEIYGFIGHNGAGKTTTLKACCGLLQPDAGDILINDISIVRNPLEAKKLLAYIPDNPDLYEFLSGIRFLSFIADVYGVSREDRDARVARFGELLGLTAELNQPVAEYSHGMKQKLAIMAALLHDPKLIVMDEPFVGLDPIASHQLKTLMRQMCDEGAAIFFSTHVLETAEKLCDKVAVIRSGRLVVAGTMDEVRGGSESLEDVFLGIEGRR